jgi:hypothetical protein
MPPKRNPNKNKEKLEKRRKKIEEERKKRKKNMDKLIEQMAAAQERAERNLRRFKKMELQIEMDKRKQENKKFNDLKVASRIAEALNKKDKDDDFSADAIRLLQELKPMEEEKEEEGISIGKLQSALRKNKVEKRKKNKDLLMKGKLKIWGDSPPSDLNFDGKLRRHSKGGRRTRKKRGKGSRPNSPQQEFADRISPPVDPFVALMQHYNDQHNSFIRVIFEDIWANQNRKLFQKIKKASGTRDDNVVIQLMKKEFATAHSTLIQNFGRLVEDYKDTVHQDSPSRKFRFEQNTLIECFDTAENSNYIGNLTENLNEHHYLFFLFVLKFLQIVVGKIRSDSKLNTPSGNYEIDPIDCFALLAIIVSYYRVYRVSRRMQVTPVFDDLCNTILLIHKPDLMSKSFKGWQRGGRKKTRKRRKKRKNRKKTRK